MWKTRKLADLSLVLACSAAIAWAYRVQADETRLAIDEKSITAARFSALVSDAQRLGPTDSPIRIVEFSDFQCAYCRAMHDTLRELVRRNPKEVAIAFRHFPLKQNGRAYGAALSAECAGQQGRFAELIDVMFARQDSLGRFDWIELAKLSGIGDTAEFVQCRQREDTRSRVLDDIKAAASLKIAGTPLLVSIGWVSHGVVSVDSLERVLNLHQP